MMRREEIRSLLARLEAETADDLESEELEFKPWDSDPKALHRTLREAVVCLANARGGTIVVGVRDRVRGRSAAIAGVGHYDPAGIRRAIYDGTDPHLLIELDELVEPEGRLILLHVPKGMPPHSTVDGITKIRIGKDCMPLTGAALARALAAGGQRDPTSEPTPAGIDQLDGPCLAELRSRLSPRAPELSRQNDEDLLSSLGLLVDGRLTLAALLLLGRAEAIARFAPQHEVILLRHTSRTRYDQRRDLRGPILAMLPELEGFIAANNRLRTIQGVEFEQLEFPDIADEVAREALLNALLHRDYFVRQGVQVALHGDYLEIVSPGGFIGGITPENILRHPPLHRNELLARVAQTAGLVNRVGVGVDRIYENLLRSGKGVPRYSTDESHVRLVLPFTTDDRFALFVRAEERAGRHLDLDDLLLLDRLTAMASLDRWTAAKVLQLAEHDAAMKLAALRERGYLVVRGRGRAATYGLRRDLSDALRGRGATDAELTLDTGALRLRILAILDERGSLANADIRRLSGFSRSQVYGLVKEMEVRGEIRLYGRGRGARILPVT